MKKLVTLVLHNLKKDKGSYLSFGFILLFSAFMLNLAFVLKFQVDQAYDTKFEQLKAAHLNFCIPEAQNSEDLLKEITAIQGISDWECRNGIYTNAVVLNFRETEFSMNTIFYNMDEPRSLNLLEVKEENKQNGSSPIYVPLYVSSFGQFGLGEEITYQIEGKDYSFLITGVVEEMQYGNYGVGLMGAYLPNDVYEEFANGKEQAKIVEYSLRVDQHVASDVIAKQVSEVLNQHGITMVSSSNSDTTKQTRTMVCNLIILILIAFACLILLVSIFLCKFRTQNSIEDDMVSLGVMKALGYTSEMMIGTIVLPFLLVGGIAAVVGCILSYVILPVLSSVLALQSGFSFELTFDFSVLVLIFGILLGITFLFTFLASKRIRKIQPIHAIRKNFDEGHSNKIYFPLATTAGKPQWILMLKQMRASVKHNVLVFFVSFVSMILIAFASVLFYNVIIKPDHFMLTMSEEMPSVIVQPEVNKEQELKDLLSNDPRVSQILAYMTKTVKLNDDGIAAFVCEDFSKVFNDLCYVGRNPQSKDEVAIGSAYEEDYKLGDSIILQNGDISSSYTIVGFVQSINHQGEICELTVNGYEKLNDLKVIPSFYVYLQEKGEATKFLNELEEKYSPLINNTVNFEKMTKTSRDMYSGITAMIIIVLFVLTMFIVLFILYVVVKSLIIKRKQEIGIYKAMGYSNRQLIFQMIGSFLPISSIGILLSAILAMFYLPPINQFIFQAVGAMRNHFEVSLIFLLIFAVLQIAINVVISILLSMPIRKISAYALIKE